MSNTNFGFLKAAAVSPRVFLGDVASNVSSTVKLAKEAEKAGASLIVFPELGLTGYTLGDLFFQEKIQKQALGGLAEIVEVSKDLEAVLCIGLPFSYGGRIFNMAAVLCKGKILGLVPKTYLPGYNEFYEERWFASGRDLKDKEVELFGEKVHVGSDILFKCSNNSDFVLGIEICEDLWVPVPPSSFAVMSGATVIANLSASNDLVGKSHYRRELVKQQSARGVCGYIYASSGVFESTTDVVYGGHSIVCENGLVLAESDRFQREDSILYSDIDLSHLRADRQEMTSFGENIHEVGERNFRSASFDIKTPTSSSLSRYVDPHPFVPKDPNERDERAREIFNIQASGLARRLGHVGSKHPIVGVSGGLDSTLALLVTVKACGLLDKPVRDIYAFTMPGLATSRRTKSNASALCKALGVSFEEIDISSGVKQHFKDIGHDGKREDTTYENTQARLRTMTLMNKANQIKGMVVGTGDLSEIALGWNTYTGDHISHYNVNCSVPKTLVKHLIEWVSEQKEFEHARRVLDDILATPISPELAKGDGKNKLQSTEELLGPYELHDFFLYHFVRWGTSPSKILFLAGQVFKTKYGNEELKKHLRTFITRFFQSQWKRSVMPDGPKVGSVSLSPRGDWRMPSDIDVEAWLKDL